jgi:hypothetical protein
MRVDAECRDGDEESSDELSPAVSADADGWAENGEESEPERDAFPRDVDGRMNTWRRACEIAISASYLFATTAKWGSGTKPERRGSRRCCTTCPCNE